MSRPRVRSHPRQQIRDAIQHFAGCFVREREQQNISRIDPFSSRYATRYEGARFPEPRRRSQGSGRAEQYRRELLFVQLSGVINVDRRGYRRALQRVLTRHVLVAHSDLDCRCKELQQPDVRKSRL
jgi:hypothetical protein